VVSVFENAFSTCVNASYDVMSMLAACVSVVCVSVLWASISGNSGIEIPPFTASTSSAAKSAACCSVSVTVPDWFCGGRTYITVGYILPIDFNFYGRITASLYRLSEIGKGLKFRAAI
jgi:hypothetical protein